MAHKTRLYARRVWREASGATAIEYALIAAGISIVIIAGVALVGGATSNNFNSVVNGLGG